MSDTIETDPSADDPDDERRTFLQAVGGTAATATGLPSTVSATDQNGASERDTVPLTHGVASGEVTAQTAVVWARAADEATLHVEFSSDEAFSPSRQQHTSVDSTTDFTGQVRLTGLKSATRYYYRVWATAGDGENGPDTRSAPDSAPTGTFVTAPGSTDEERVMFAWSGDTWGYGDDPVEPPFPGLRTIAEQEPDFFLYHGDTIYADAQTPAGKITENTPIDDALEIYRDKYKEMRDPPAEVAEQTYLQELLESTSVYTVWDDHEVINNFAGPIEPLMPEGRRAFREYWPLDRDADARPGDSNRFYDSFRWGKHVELFIIDTRQYRDPNVERDSKTLLGDEQLEWLKDALADSDATWKLLASPAPLGHPSDSWATPADRTGYEAELLELIKHIQTEPISNLVVIAGDIHKSVVGAYDPDNDGEFEFFEAIAGPLGAPAGLPDDLYSPLNPTEFFAKGEYTNFGTVEVDESGDELTINIYDEEGTEQFSKTIQTSDINPETKSTDRIQSTFDEDADGWHISQNGGSDHPNYREIDGNPGGHISDEESQGGIAWYYQAPFKFLGDREAFYGGTLSFDLRQAQTDQQFDAEPTEGGDILLASGEKKLVYEFRGSDATPDKEWSTFEVPLTADAIWVDVTSEEPLATEETFRTVLSDLEVLRIRGEYRSGDDMSYLDNVVLTKD
ncbi:alkaline phosphatase D family protein [Natronococcus wangiae]|uniref:alkaline phosphatase D family protein n=1 Tax=Natronococcus wangiae TaxID=3068275 RepID=UPI00273EDE6A|nr:alkaline phosphatase D family protein [Natronococcus sp. AD5]